MFVLAFPVIEMHRSWRWVLIATAAVAPCALAVATWRALMPLPTELVPGHSASIQRFLAADGTPLSYSLRGRLNVSTTEPMWRVPDLMRKAFVISEDKRYWEHGGVDWVARLKALWSNWQAGQIIRGASTIGEQVARILRPRPRTYWSHWIAGFDASRLLQRFGHAQVLEFYLNQVPYGARRRGVVQAASYYFGRDLSALDPAEQVALAVLVRSPARYDPRNHPRSLRWAVDQLAQRMQSSGVIGTAEAQAVLRAPIIPGQQKLSVDAGPFVAYAERRARTLGLQEPVLRTTLDPTTQGFVQQTLIEHQHALGARGVTDAAALVVDNESGDVLAWAVAPKAGPFAMDAVVTPRQPGSTLKPFVYGLAMERLGWQPDTVIEDTPLAEHVGSGVHSYRNYSGRHYGRVSVRYALANSLNVPAIRTAQDVGVAPILTLLQHLGFSTFRRSADYYGPAIVLGDGAVPLYDLVQGYASLARHGAYLPLHVLEGAPRPDPIPVLSPDVASVLASILSDANARSAEFGADSVLDIPYPTAVKTGTSSDYRDAWAVGFDNRYTVGIWMGRLGGGSTDGVTGSTGPAPVLREIFAYLRRDEPYAGLWRSPSLRLAATCEWIGPPPCVQRNDWVLPFNPHMVSDPAQAIAIARPLSGEVLAFDPRLPISSQIYQFKLSVHGEQVQRVDWRLDGRMLATTTRTYLDWPLMAGAHRLSALVWLNGSRTAAQATEMVDFRVVGGD